MRFLSSMGKVRNRVKISCIDRQSDLDKGILEIEAGEEGPRTGSSCQVRLPASDHACRSVFCDLVQCLTASRQDFRIPSKTGCSRIRGFDVGWGEFSPPLRRDAGRQEFCISKESAYEQRPIRKSLTLELSTIRPAVYNQEAELLWTTFEDVERRRRGGILHRRRGIIRRLSCPCIRDPLGP